MKNIACTCIFLLCVSFGELSAAPVVQIDTVPEFRIDSTVVSADRTYIRNIAGGMIYDVQSDPDAKNLKIKEFMTKIPGMAVNGSDGKLSFENGRNYLILVDGKKNLMLGNRSQYSMNLIQADYMKSIEILDPPPAEYSEYDIVINIVLEKNLPDGITGELSASASLLETYSPKADFTFKAGKFIANLAYSYSYSEPPGLGYEYTRELYADDDTLTQFYRSESCYYNTRHDLSVAASYDATEKTSVSLHFGTGAERMANFSSSRSYDITDGTEQNVLDISSKHTTYSRPAFNAKASLNHDIENGKLTLSYNLDNSDTRDEYYLDDLSWTHGRSIQNSVMFNYTQSFKNRHRLFASAKYIHRNYGNSSDTQYCDLYGNTWNAGLDYIQQVASAEVTYNFMSRSWLLAARLRGEYTNNSGNYLQESITPLKYSDFCFLPVITATYMMPNTHRLNLTLNSSPMRPGINYLNPYVDDSDPMNIRVGNPDLKPETLYGASLSYKFPLFRRKVSMRFS